MVSESDVGDGRTTGGSTDGTGILSEPPHRHQGTHPPFRQRHPVCLVQVYGSVEGKQDTYQHDTMWRPAAQRNGREGEQYGKERMAICL